jgi:hypothetical protein
MKVKGSIAVFAAASALAGSVSAATLEDCQTAIGWAAWMGGSALPVGTTAEIKRYGASDLNQFIKNLNNTKRLQETCSVPKNVKGGVSQQVLLSFEDSNGSAILMTQDECSLYNTVASADGKYNVGKFADAASLMSSLALKANTLAGQGKLTNGAAAAISSEAMKAYNVCLSLQQ